MSSRDPNRPRRARGDQGAALVETAILTPVFFLFIFGIIEFGVVYRDYLTIADGVAAGARIGSIVGPGEATIQVDDGSGSLVGVDVNGDFAAMKAVREDLVAIPIDWIDRVIIFEGKAPSNNVNPVDQVPAACKVAPPPASLPGCNIYEPREAFLTMEGTIEPADLEYFQCISPGDPACGWDPDDRENIEDPTTGASEIEYLGVYIKVRRPYLTGIFGDEFTVEQAHVLRLEPGVVSLT